MLYRAKLEHAELNGAVLPSAHLEKADLTNANLVRADLKGAHLASAELVQADLTGANLSGAQVDASTSFIGATLTDADFFGVNVRCLDLAGVEYSKAKNFDRRDCKNNGVTLKGDTPL